MALARVDLMCVKKTGTGKTTCHAVALVHETDFLLAATQKLVFCPEKEIASQVSPDLQKVQWWKFSHR